MFGHRQDGLKILERGKPIRAIVPVLEKFLKQHSGDIILQKWLIDFVAAAREMRPKRTIRQTEKAREGDLKRKCPDTSDTSMSSIEPNDDDDLSTDDFAPESSESSDNIDSPQPEPPMESHEPRQKSRPASKKWPAKKAKKTGPPHDAIPQASNKRYVDVMPTLPANTSRSGAPSLCATPPSRTQNPELYSQAEIELSRRAPGARLGPQQAGLAQNDEGVSAPTTLPETSQQRSDAVKSFFAPFAEQGKLNTTDRINLAIVRLLCSAGVPPKIAESLDWKRLFFAVNPRLVGYTPPSATTLRDVLIPAEAREAMLNACSFLKAH
ncbi:hypothetical protein FS749_009850 [Ceratobasidium sp. UAMH 11750]|nr:hypothetical protein FS749_009850 [Ceratobasidium sp. UAMH 11750]